jgi:hypothetical protein
MAQRIANAAGAGKQAVQIVETAVFAIDHHDVLDPGQGARGGSIRDRGGLRQAG